MSLLSVLIPTVPRLKAIARVVRFGASIPMSDPAALKRYRDWYAKNKKLISKRRKAKGWT